MTSVPENPASQVEEGPWIEIIQRMESLYANLAQTQIEAERKNEELQRAKAFTDNIIRSMVNSLIVTDRDSNITTANDASCQLLGYAREELLGKPAALVFVDGAPNPFLRGSELWNRCRATGSGTGVETSLKTKSGEDVPVSLNASVMRDQTGDVIGMLLVATDLREMKRLLLEAQAAAAAQREQAAERGMTFEAYRKTLQRLYREKIGRFTRGASEGVEPGE